MAHNNLYSQKVLKIFGNPKNFGELKNPDGEGRVGNIRCGDEMWLYLKIDSSKEIISDIKIKTFGCVAAIATSSVVADLARGKTLDKALKINEQSILKSTGPLPSVKIHCSLLASDALREAIYNYLEKNKKPISKTLEAMHQKILLKNKMLSEKFGLKS
jgi:nitrogen fixation NifU-like protein